MVGPEDFLGDFFDRSKAAPKAKPEVQEKGVQLRGRDFNGTWYIRGEDVVGLLEANRVLPKISARIRARLKQSG